MAFAIESPAFRDSEVVPRQFTCDGDDTPPPLTVSGPPDGTRSFAVIMEDPDAPGGTFTHWLAYDIPVRDGQLDVHVAKALPNSFGRAAYGGPCPPRGHGPHRYYFKVYAVDVRSLPLAGEGQHDLEVALDRHTLAIAELMGRYERNR